ncbi:MAG TPA: DAK2 domain-containing protein [Actinomycetota bacterium]
MARQLSAVDLAAAVRQCLASLRAQREQIDAANVFPVADADTGSNLVMTFEAAVAALESAGDGDHAIAAALIEGTLKGARGNSGVITAQIVHALAVAVADGPIGAPALGRAMTASAVEARAAVAEPAPGTILTVADAAAGATASAGDVAPDEQLTRALGAARAALAHTPQENPVLGRAGVIDAGGMGLVLFLEALAAAAGATVEPVPWPAAEAAATAADPEPDDDAGVEVQFTVSAPADRIPALRQLLGTIGTSVAVSGGGDRWRVHLHTHEPDRAVAMGEAVGDVTERSEESIVLGGSETPAAPRVRMPRPLADQPVPGERGARATGSEDVRIVAVVDAGGIAKLFTDLGAVAIEVPVLRSVGAGELASQLAAIPGAHLIVLPNDEEVFAAAVAAAGGGNGRLRVVRTTDQASGLAAAIAGATARPLGERIEDMTEVLGRVRSGLVVQARAPVETMEGPVAPGQMLGFAEGLLVYTGDNPVEAATEVAKELVRPGNAVVTVLAGRDAGAAERRAVEGALSAALAPVTVELHRGGQATHRYVMAAE